MRVAFDIGGTFTDVIAVTEDGRIVTAKILSLLQRIADDIAEIIRDDAAGERVDAFIHATTQASNAVIENRMAKVGLITTRGFRDNLEMRNLRRPRNFDLNWSRLPALVPRHLRFEVNERILSDASIDEPIDLNHARQTISSLLECGVDALAVCLINSYLNPVHEEAVQKLIMDAGPGIPVCLSSEIRPEIGEYERTSTTVINAALIPVVDRYLRQIEERLAEYSPRLLVMQSNGGLMPASTARVKPCLMIESGPAAGSIAAAHLARQLGYRSVLSVDMGGTTAKACLIDNFEPLQKSASEIGGGVNVASRSYSGAGHAIRAPSIDLVEVGAGGGSIAWIDTNTVLHVGPQSAGAEPGPACYGRGGDKPTVTDANCALGYLSPKTIAGQTLAIDRAKAIEAIDEHLAKPLQRSVTEVAFAITELANSTMTRAIRAVSIDRGRDPRNYVMFAFGGAGPMHAASLASAMGLRHVVIPVYPGLFSALGLLLADFRQDYISSLAIDLARADTSLIRQEIHNLRQKAYEDLKIQGIAEESVRFLQSADLKYKGQTSTLTLDYSNDWGDDPCSTLATEFSAAHHQAFSYSGPGTAIELVSLRLRAIAPAGSAQIVDLMKNGAASPGNEEAELRPAYFGPRFGMMQARIRERTAITSEESGPVIVEENDTTIVVPPDWSVSRDKLNNLHLKSDASPA